MRLPVVSSSVPWEQDVFPSFEALLAHAQTLSEQSDGQVRYSEFGKSRTGAPLALLSIGEGDRVAVVLGGVHPNEPVGGLTALRLAAMLAEDDDLRSRLGFTWHIAVCVDPDGLALNEGWFATPASRSAYEEHCFRPAPDEQVEWAFPLTVGDYTFDRPLPETQAMMSLLDRTEPALVVTLHNCELGGAYFRLSQPRPELYEPLLRICADAGIEPDRGSPEDPFATILAPAVIANGHPAELYERMESGGDFAQEWGTGCSAIHYSERTGGFGLIPEVPLWTSSAGGRDELATTTRGDAHRRAGQTLVLRGAEIVAALESVQSHLVLDTPVTRAAVAFAPTVGATGEELLRAAQVDPHQQMTIGHVSALEDTVHMHSIRYGSLLLRAVAAELHARPDQRQLLQMHTRLSERVKVWRDDFAQQAEWSANSISRLTRVQTEAIVATATSLRPA